jgi:hypothetical protein
MPTDGGLAADPAFTAAIVGLRQQCTAYHLTHGLLGSGGYLSHPDDDEAAVARSAKPVTLPAACAASRCWVALVTSFPQRRGSEARR